MSRRRKQILAVVSLALPVLVYVVLTQILSLMLFHPSREEAREVERLGQRVVYRASDGVRLSSWLVRARGPRRRTLVYFHGNAATAHLDPPSCELRSQVGHFR